MDQFSHDLAGHSASQQPYSSYSLSSTSSSTVPSASSYQPQASGCSPLPKHDRKGSQQDRLLLRPHLAGPATLPGLSVPILPGKQPVSPVEKVISAPEKDNYVQDCQRAAAKITTSNDREIHPKDEQPRDSSRPRSPYQQALSFVEDFRLFLAPPLPRTSEGLRPRLPAASEGRRPHRPLEDYERPQAFQISVQDWLTLYSDLKLAETEDV
jgi:hypothetical protein